MENEKKIAEDLERLIDDIMTYRGVSREEAQEIAAEMLKKLKDHEDGKGSANNKQ